MPRRARAGWLWLLLATLLAAGVSMADELGAHRANLPLVMGAPKVMATPTSTATPTPWPTLHALVTHIADGDTIDVRYHEVTLRVRYIGVDTPERGQPTRGTGYCYGYPAATRNAEIVQDRWVDLERDVDERGPYNRHLFYVYVDGEMVNKQLIEEGFGLSYPVPDNLKHVDSLIAAEDRARAAQLGLWGACVAAKPTPDFPVPNDPAHGVRITYMHYTNDSEPEYVRLTNYVDVPVSLSDWALVSQRGGQHYDFEEDEVLGAGENLYIASGPGARERRGPPRHILWGLGYRWNDDGDRAVLCDSEGLPVDAWAYGDY